ncbi:OmpH family outer membrane protein [Glaesserella sp.]|uniref:OmpH family outer membrane protein n=1 Tax=Glaesserella sp. TaxID=2094731 RepID=UPI0035A0FBCB
MKNLFKLSVITAALAFATNATNAADNIAYVNPGFLMQNHPLLADPNSEFVKEMKAEEAKFAEAEKKLADEEKKLADDAKKLQDEEKKVSDSLQKKAAALEKEAPRLRSADIKKRQDAINAEGKAFQNKIDALQKRETAFRKNVEEFQKQFGGIQRGLAEKQAKIQQSIMGEVEKAIADTAKAKGFTLVLDSTAVLYTQNEANDLTEEVFKALGGQIKPQAENVKPATETPAVSK